MTEDTTAPSQDQAIEEANRPIAEQRDFRPKSLDDLLMSEPVEAAEAQPPAESEPIPETEPAAAPPEALPVEPKPEEAASNDTGESSDAPPASAAEPASDPGENKTVPLAALEDERRKRQELESRMAAFEEKQRQAERPDPEIDPEGAAAFDTQESYRWFVGALQEQMRMQFHDYDEVEQVFNEEAAKNLGLAQQLYQSANPAVFAYKEGLRLKQVRDMGENPQEFLAQMREQITAEVKESLRAETATNQAQTAVAGMTESLAEAPSIPNRNVQRFAGPTSMDKILNPKRR